MTTTATPQISQTYRARMDASGETQAPGTESRADRFERESEPDGPAHAGAAQRDSQSSAGGEPDETRGRGPQSGLEPVSRTGAREQEHAEPDLKAPVCRHEVRPRGRGRGTDIREVPHTRGEERV